MPAMPCASAAAWLSSGLVSPSWASSSDSTPIWSSLASNAGPGPAHRERVAEVPPHHRDALPVSSITVPLRRWIEPSVVAANQSQSMPTPVSP